MALKESWSQWCSLWCRGHGTRLTTKSLGLIPSTGQGYTVLGNTSSSPCSCLPSSSNNVPLYLNCETLHHKKFTNVFMAQSPVYKFNDCFSSQVIILAKSFHSSILNGINACDPKRHDSQNSNENTNKQTNKTQKSTCNYNND